ncbi:hypothetical protein Tco_0994801 [Tanacetum coccineum]
MEDDKETNEHEEVREDDEAEMKKYMEVVQDDEEIAIDVIPLATKPPIIVEYKIVKEGQKGFYHLIRADGIFYNVNDKDDDNGDDDNSDDNDDGGNDDGGNKGNFEENPSFSLEDYEEEEKDKEYVYSPKKDKSNDEEKMGRPLVNTTEVKDAGGCAGGVGEPSCSDRVSSDFTSKLLNLDNTSPDVNEIASLMNTSTIPPSPPPVNPSSHLTITP